MYTNNKEVFANTCGKIFKDRIILATHKETTIPFRSIASITLKKRYDKSSLLFALLPAILIVLPYVFPKDTQDMKTVLLLLGVLGVIVCVLKVKKAYSLNLKTQSGRLVKIKVWEGNKKEAQKFIDKTTSMINKAKAVPESEFSGKPVIA
ncbi:hypothetical protein ACLI1A_03630 [Flavobacterium sp. RHBU_3]|uniref:hypothetical protein n=1 Tax=Flavobacterium sp. RHBU_3 TaxID=3391184 RepID=UPI0039854B31